MKITTSDPTKAVWKHPTIELPPLDELPPDESAEPPLLPISASDLCRRHKELRKVVVQGIAREREVVNFVSVSKVGKTFLAMGLGLSVASGHHWLNTFAVSQGVVLYLDCELHAETLAKRVTTVASAMGITSGEFAERFDVLPLRGRLKDLHKLGGFFASIPVGKYRLIILDALYRLTPERFDENSNADVTQLYNLLDKYAELTGATFLVIHHASKGHQSGKAVIDVGSGAGAQSRAADTHLVLRPHADAGVVVMEAAIRSFAPLAPMCIRWEYPVWAPAPECDPTQLAEVKPRRIRAQQAAVDPEPEPEPWTPERFVKEFAATEPREQKTIIARATTAGLSDRKATSLCRVAIADRLLHHWTFSDRRVAYLATIEQPVTSTTAAPK